MARLKTLGLRLKASPLTRLTLSPHRAGIERKRGSAGVKDRDRIRKRDHYMCQPCLRVDRVTSARIVDHIKPLWAGGSDDDDNKQVICQSCHDAKTAREARDRGRGV